MRDHYATLGLATSATTDEVKRAWRAASLQWHPDRCKAPDAATRFAAASEAYETLSDPDRRRRYDLERLTASPAAAQDGAELLARQHLGRDLTARERVGVSWLSFAASLAKRR